MTLSTAKLQALHASGRAVAGDYVDWAIGVLASGADSPNLRILAGLDSRASPFEAEEHFVRARKELGLPAPDGQRALWDYAIGLAETILDPRSDYQALVSELAGLCQAHDYPAFLAEWEGLEDGLAAVRAGSYPYGFEALYQSDSRKIVTDVARAFLSQAR